MKHESLSSILQNLHDDLPAGQEINLGDIIHRLHQRGFGVLLILFALPLCIPIPKPPPVDTILGLPLMILTWQMLIGSQRPVLPAKILAKRLRTDFLRESISRGLPYFRRFEKLFRPRMEHFADHTLQRLCGLFGLIMSLSVLIPFPLSNTFPSICLIVMSVGIAERDGFAAMAAAFIGVAFIIMLSVAAFFGIQLAFNFFS